MSEKLNRRIHRTARKLVDKREPQLIRQAVGKLATFGFWKRLKFVALILKGEKRP